MFIGEREVSSSSGAVVYSDFFASNGMPVLPDVVVKSVEADLAHHLDSQALGSPLETFNRSSLRSPPSKGGIYQE